MNINAKIEMNVCPCKHSRCEVCFYYIKNRECWINSYIPTYTWNNSDEPKEFNCDKFKSMIPNQYNNCYVHRDYENKKLFPEKVFGGKYRFNSKGERI